MMTTTTTRGERRGGVASSSRIVRDARDVFAFLFDRQRRGGDDDPATFRAVQELVRARTARRTNASLAPASSTRAARLLPRANRQGLRRALHRSITHHRRRRSRARASHARAVVHRHQRPRARVRLSSTNHRRVVEILRQADRGRVSPKTSRRRSTSTPTAIGDANSLGRCSRRVPSSTSFVVSRTIERWSDRVESRGQTRPTPPEVSRVTFSRASTSRRDSRTRARTLARANGTTRASVERARPSSRPSSTRSRDRFGRRRRHGQVGARRV